MKENKGITLIALVITIIVLLIAKALKAKTENEIQAYYEKIELIRNDLRLQNPGFEPPTLEQLKNEFDTNQTDWIKSTSREEIQKIDTIILITKEGYMFYVTEDGTRYMAKGEITKAEAPKITAKSIDMGDCVRKTEKYFADLFEIEWASDGAGKIEYTVTRKLDF